MKTDENGYRLLVRACGPNVEKEMWRYDPKTNDYRMMPIDPEPFRLQVYEKLGLDPNEKPTMKIESLDTFIHQYEKEHPQTEWEKTLYNIRRKKTFWTFDEFPMFKDSIEENSAGLNLLAEAVRKPVFRIPFTRESENTPIYESVVSLETTQGMRELARAAQGRIEYRLGIGDIEGTIDDIMTVHHLARHAGKQGTLVSALVGVAIEGMAYSKGIGSNPEFSPTKEQIERLVAEFNALPPRQTLTEVIESERLYGLAHVQDMYWSNNPFLQEGQSSGKLNPYMGWMYDINIFMKKVNKVYDVLTGKSKTVDGKELEDLFKPSWNPLPHFFVHSRSDRFADQMSAEIIPAMQASREAWRRCECAENMQRLTLALLLYEKDHGKLPEGDWREAIRPYLAGTPAEEAGVPAKYFRCPSHRLEEGYTAYAMIGDVPDAVSSPMQILLVEVSKPQKLGEGDGRIPYEKAKFWRGESWDSPKDFDGLGSYHPGTILAGFRSGAVRSLSETMSPEKLQELLDGTATEPPW
jgi:hypothetical protein